MQIITTLLPPPCFSDTTIASDCRKATNLQLEYHIWNIHLQTHTHTHTHKWEKLVLNPQTHSSECGLLLHSHK